MRKREKEITEKKSLEEIIKKAEICRLAMCNEGLPYIVPLCFGYEDDALYFHCAHEGKKIDILRRNPEVCFEIEIDQEIIGAEDACRWTMKYRSVIGFGTVEFIEDDKQKRRALNIIMRQYSDGSFSFPDKNFGLTEIIRVDIRNMTGKQSGY